MTSLTSKFVFFKSMLFAKFTQAHAAFGWGICHPLIVIFLKGDNFCDFLFASLDDFTEKLDSLTREANRNDDGGVAYPKVLPFTLITLC